MVIGCAVLPLSPGLPWQKMVRAATHELAHTVGLIDRGLTQDEPWVMNYWHPWYYWQASSHWWQQDLAQKYEGVDFPEVTEIDVKNHYTVAP